MKNQIVYLYNQASSSGEVYKRTYYLKEDKIRLIYHLGPEKIVACVREYKKPIGDQKFQNVEELVHIFEVDPLAKLPKRQDIYSQFAECTKAELNALQAIKASDREVSEILQLRKAEESSIQLSISIYDTLRNETVQLN